MALKTHYLASEEYAMDRRSRRLHRFLVSSPVALLIAISAVGHLRKPAYHGAAGTVEYDRRVLAYRDRVVAADGLTSRGAHASFAPLRTEAQNWADGFRTGKLAPLQPAAYEDHLREGVRGDVLTSGIRLSAQLSAAARRALHQGRFPEAANASLLATETATGMRRFELEAYVLCLHSARRPLDLLGTAWPNLTVQQRLNLKPRLEALKVDLQEPQALVQLDDRLIEDYLSRQGRQSSVPRQNPFALAKAREQRTGTAQKVTAAHNRIISAMIGSST